MLTVGWLVVAQAAASAPSPTPAPGSSPPATATPAPTSAPDAATPAPPTAARADRGSPSAVRESISQLGGALAASLRGRETTGFHRLAVMPFEALGAEAREKDLGRVSAELLASRLTLEPRLLQVERARLGPILEELERSDQGKLSPEGAASVGRLVGANRVVVGSVAEAGAEYLVTARVVDTETAQVLAAADQSLSREGFVALSEDLVEVKSRAGAALRSAVLPGWGQLYNGDTGRGVAYLSLFASAAIGAAASAWLGSSAEDDYHRNTPDTVDRREDANAHYQRVNVLLVSAGVVWAVAVADAFITGRDSREVHVPVESAEEE